MFTTLPLELFVCREVIEQYFFPHEAFNPQRHLLFTTSIIFASMFSELNNYFIFCLTILIYPRLHFIHHTSRINYMWSWCYARDHWWSFSNRTSIHLPSGMLRQTPSYIHSITSSSKVTRCAVCRFRYSSHGTEFVYCTWESMDSWRGSENLYIDL